MKESDIQRQILRYLGYNKDVALAWRQNTGGAYYPKKDGTKQFVRFGERGVSDILGMLKGGQFFAIEVKRPGGKPTPHQAAFLKSIEDAGGISILAHSIEDVSAVI